MSKQMKLTAFSFVLATWFLSTDVQPLHASTIYEIVPRTLQPGDYTVTGTIETDGTIGELTARNIVSYDVLVSGAHSYRFTPANPGSVIDEVDGLTAFGDSLYLPAAIRRGFNRLRLQAQDNSPLFCTDCTQGLLWNTSSNRFRPPPIVSFTYRDSVDDDPSAHPLWQQPTHGALTIATVVPEPGAFALMALGLLGLLGFGWRRR